MNYVKLTPGGFLKFAPNPLRVGDNNVYNAPAEVYLQDCWKPLKGNAYPEDAPEGYHYEEKYVEKDDCIEQTWELVQDPIPSDDDELDPMEALSIILGGEI